MAVDLMSSLFNYPGQTAPVKIVVVKAGQTCKTCKDIERGRSNERMGEEEMKREIAGERRKEEREGEVPLSVPRRREAKKLFFVAIISPSRVRKRGARKEARENGKNSANERERLRERGFTGEREVTGEKFYGRERSVGEKKGLLPAVPSRRK